MTRVRGAFEVDETGQYKPGLPRAGPWPQMGSLWTCSCTRGIHHGYGEFTAKDVVHNHALWCDEQYPGAKTRQRVATEKAFVPSNASR